MAPFENLVIPCGSDPLREEWGILNPAEYQKTKAQFELLAARGFRPEIIAKLLDVNLLTHIAPQVFTVK